MNTKHQLDQDRRKTCLVHEHGGSCYTILKVDPPNSFVTSSEKVHWSGV